MQTVRVPDVPGCEVHRAKVGMRMKQGVIPDYETSTQSGPASGVFPRVSPSLSILLSRRDFLLANLSGPSSKVGGGADPLCFSGRPVCGSEPREKTGAATSSLPPFFDRGVRSLATRAR